MHVLLTTDSVGGVWTYTEELSAGLVRGGHRVTLVSFGFPLDAGQRAWVASMHSQRFECIETEYRLEWMENAGEDLQRSSELLRALVARLQPDLLHSNQFAFGDLSNLLPVLVTGHSDVLSWWSAVHREPAPDNGRLRAYTAVVRGGLLAATRLAAPTAWMARELREQYGIDRPIEVVANGRSPELFLPNRPKTLQAITVGRAWDPGKNVALLEDVHVPLPLYIAGEPAPPHAPAHTANAAPALGSDRLTYLGKRSASELREWYSRTAIYIATSRYEPFGLAPLEAALSGAALVLSDLPTLREIWDEAALFYPAGDPQALERTLRGLAEQPESIELQAKLAHERARSRYTASAMVARHESLYGSLARVHAA